MFQMDLKKISLNNNFYTSVSSSKPKREEGNILSQVLRNLVPSSILSLDILKINSELL